MLAVCLSVSAPATAQASPATSPHNEVFLRDGTLTVQAHNTTVRRILQQISQESGMVIDGPIPDASVFGQYGPGNPAVVMSELLDGLGYNILMTGSARSGAPQTLLLTPRSGTATPPSPTSLASSAPASGPVRPAPEASAPAEPELGPGAIAHARPEPTTDDPQARAQSRLNRLRTMQQARQQADTNP